MLVPLPGDMTVALCARGNKGGRSFMFGLCDGQVIGIVYAKLQVVR